MPLKAAVSFILVMSWVDVSVFTTVLVSVVVVLLLSSLLQERIRKLARKIEEKRRVAKDNFIKE